MKIMPKKMREKWEPILQGWLDESNIQGGDLNIKLYESAELSPNERGRLNIRTQRIHLPIGSNNLKEIKFCFFHEIGHFEQTRSGWLSISSLRKESTKPFEVDAAKFALLHGAKPTKYIKWCWDSWNITKEELK